MTKGERLVCTQEMRVRFSPAPPKLKEDIMAKKKKKSDVQRVRQTMKGDYVDPQFILSAYRHLKPTYHLPPIEEFTLSILSLALPMPGMKFKRTKTGFEISIPLSHVVKTLKLEPRL